MIIYSLIIPVYNEQNTLKKLLKQLKKINSKIEVIIVNDGSTDKTKVILEKEKSFKLIHHDINKGKAKSILSALRIAAGQFIILLDGDLEIEINCIDKIINKHKSNRDSIIIGNRWNNESNSGINFHNVGNSLINFFFNFIYKVNYKDILCCVKLIEKNIFKSLNIESRRFSIEAELMAKITLLRLKVYEIDVIYNRRTIKEGKKLKLSDGFNIIRRIILLKYFRY